MGYACPVCEVPQSDGEHLANHLAFTAMLRGEDHEAWLDDHVPDWGDRSPADLAPSVTDHAEETTYEAVFEDTTDAAHDHDHGHGGADAGFDRGRPDVDVAGAGAADAAPSEEARAVIAEARELTRQMRADEGDDPVDGDESSDAGDSAAHDDDAGDGDATVTDGEE